MVDNIAPLQVIQTKKWPSDYANEKEAGDGIQRAIKDGLVKREDIFITTKLWNNYHKKYVIDQVTIRQRVC